MTLEELIAQVNSEGKLVNNLFQVDASLWRCSLRAPLPSGDNYYDFGEGSSAIAALASASEKIDFEFMETPVIRSGTPPIKQKKAGPSSIEELGL